MRKFSRKQIGAVGLAVLMSAQGPVMAAEVAQEETTSAVEVQTEEDDVTLPETVEESTEETIGELIYFFELACAMSGKILGVNPFNQPGVEEYKKNMFTLLGKPGYNK